MIKYSLSANGSRGSRFPIALLSAVFLSSGLCWLPEAAHAQSSGSSAPPLADGHPDLSGLWDFTTLTPLQRPKDLAGKEFFANEQEAAKWASKKMKEIDFDRRDGGAQANIDRGYNEYWTERGLTVKTLRTSLVVDPPDGRIPKATPFAAKRRKEEYDRMVAAHYDGPEDLSTIQRCLKVEGEGPPIDPTLYNNNVRITEGAGYVVILHEMNHETRVVPIDGSVHLPEQIRLWNGDPRGHWEGDTLVVESTNFRADAAPMGTSQNVHLTERFKRLDNDTLQYRFTIDDPAAYTRPWTAEVPARKTAGPLVEYACHEGNDTMANTLAASRAEEKSAAALGARK
jgi:hypothetical protein